MKNFAAKVKNASKTDKFIALVIFAVVPFVGTLTALAYLNWRGNA